MKRSAIFLGLAASAAFVMPALAETRTYERAAFEKIDLSAGIVLIATAGEKQSITVETEDGDFSDLEIDVANGVLSVSREWNRLRWHQKKADYKVIVTAREISGLDASSGSHATLSKIDSRVMSVDMSSGAYAVVLGRSDNCTIDISSGANLDAHELVCDSATIDVSSGGHGEVFVRQSLVGDASSGGHVAVYGNPERVNIDKSSGGQIKVKMPKPSK